MQTVGPYALHRRLSSCELGEVWAARDAAERPFTVAVLAPAAAEGGWREAFAAAANTLARSDGLPITGANHTGPVPWVACAAEQGAGAAHVFLALGQRLVPAGEPPAGGPPAGPSGAPAPAHRPTAGAPATGTPLAGAPAAGTTAAAAGAAGTPAPDGHRTDGPAGPTRPGVPTSSTGSAPSAGAVASPGPASSAGPASPAGPAAVTGGTVPPAVAPRPTAPTHPTPPHPTAPPQASPPQRAPQQAGPHRVAPQQAGPHPAPPRQVTPPQVGPHQMARQQAGPQQAVPQRVGPPYPPTPLAAPFPPAPFPPVAGPARGRGRAVLWSVLVALLAATLGATGGYLVAARTADGPASVAAPASATPSVDLGLPGTPPRRPGVEPPVGGGWPAGAPTFAGTEPTREITGLAGVDFSFRVPTGWSCTEAARTSGSAHYRCGVPAADGSIIGGDLVVRQCPRLCTDERRTALRRQEEAWGLQWIRSGEFTTWAETARVDGAPRYGLVYLSYWRSVPEDAIDRQLVLRMTAPPDRADEVRKVAASVREATFTI
ncbi:hypothetical protein ACWCHM_01435 [Micromonospora sp. SCSIO 07396]